MKKIYFLLPVLALAMVSCEDFLTTEPINKVSAEQYYGDEAGITQGLAAVYAAIQTTYGNDIIKYYNVCTDEGYYANNSTTTGLAVNNITTSDANVQNLWTNCYLGINRANDLIAHIDVPVMDETKRKAILGEALFMRGYYHFLLVTHFGSVPIKTLATTSPNDVYLSQSSIAEVYEQILKDMKAAEQLVNTSTNLGFSGRVSKTVVEGILARVCLQMAGYPLNDTSKYAEALAWTKKVQSSGEHALKTSVNPDPSWSYNAYTPSPVVKKTLNTAYSQIFINEAKDIYDTKEVMWEIEFNNDRTSSYNELGGVGQQNGIQMGTVANNALLGQCYGYIMGVGRLYFAYPAADLRRDWVLGSFYYNLATSAENPVTNTSGYSRYCAKWRRTYEIGKKDVNGSGINFPVLRYSDVLLMMAEAENKVNGPTAIAYQAVNQVRRRGYGLDINTVSAVADLPAGLTQAQFQTAVENERYLELCFEGTRRLDLIRWGKDRYLTTMATVGNEIATYKVNGGAGPQQYGKIGYLNATERMLLYPIPSKEIAINHNLVQNPGW